MSGRNRKKKKKLMKKEKKTAMVQDRRTQIRHVIRRASQNDLH
jgi:hypothetical protein